MILRLKSVHVILKMQQQQLKSTLEKRKRKKRKRGEKRGRREKRDNLLTFNEYYTYPVK